MGIRNIHAIGNEPITVIKRDLSHVPYNAKLISAAVQKSGLSEEDAKIIANDITKHLLIQGNEVADINDIQTLVIKFLDFYGHQAQKAEYLEYMLKRDEARKRGAVIVGLFGEIVDHTHESMTENANINAHGAMGKMLKIGSEVSKEAYMHDMPKKFSKAHMNGQTHIHDLDFHHLTTTCVQIDLEKLFGGEGFDTGHGNVRPPKRIGSYASLACIAIQANQNDQHGGQSIPCFDYYLAPGVVGSYRANFEFILETMLETYDIMTAEDSAVMINILKEEIQTLYPGDISQLEKSSIYRAIENYSGYIYTQLKMLIEASHNKAMIRTDHETFQAMEAVVHNLNTMHSRAGAQVPFSNLNYGTDTSIAGRMVTKNILTALYKGMGKGEIPIFPIHIFKVKSGINRNPGDPNYDLFQYAWKVTAKRLFPNYSNLDVDFNAAYYQEGRPETEVAYMGCRTRVIGNVYDSNQEVVTGRGNITYSSINLPRIALEVKENFGDTRTYFEILDERLELVLEQLLYRYSILKEKYVKNYPFLMGQGVWLNSEKLDNQTTVGEVLKHGTLSIGFVGLAEALYCLHGAHHAQDEEAQRLGLKIIKRMCDFCDRKSQELQMNITLLATPAESLAGRFLKIDKAKYGIIEDVTSHDYYTNSFHVPVHYQIDMYSKIKIEAPYHKLCNAGHISYVETDGDLQQNPEAIGAIINMMFDLDIGYGAINTPVDYDPVCHYTGVIGNKCPRCGREEEEGAEFVKIRRVTGYLADMDFSFNPAKIAEVRDRVIHTQVLRKFAEVSHE